LEILKHVINLILWISEDVDSLGSLAHEKLAQLQNKFGHSVAV
jgi:hypothetical protein